ncbi:restriction endonuclease [Williamsia muralis]|uniref:restriction endonuclease n=1 Tax=Williamsia marianensis TaxID=85044 RepID=UPI003F144FFE
MTQIWGIHNDVSNLDLVDGRFVSIGWDEIGDLKAIGADRASIKSQLAAAYPASKPGAFPVWAGVLLRFGFEMERGDLVVAPNKADSTINFGEVVGDYQFLPDEPTHRHRRSVRWLRTGVPRAVFSQKALYEIGSALTLFRVKNHAAEFERFLASSDEAAFAASTPPADSPEDTEEAVKWAEEEPNVDRIGRFTRDFVASKLHKALSHEEFEHFTADLMRTLGYQARVTQYSADGGVDVLAHKDPLGLEPPLIKIQCKHMVATIGAPDVQRLAGTLSRGELGLFVSLGTYSKDALALERNRLDLRLIGGDELIDLFLDSYADLPQKWRDRVALRQVYVVETGAAG